MKKISALVAALCVGLFAVFSCAKRAQLVVVDGPVVVYDSGVTDFAITEPVTHDAALVTVPVDDVMNTISEDNWEFAMPGPDWVAQPNEVRHSDIKKVFVNEVLGARVMFVKMKMPLSFKEFAVLSINSIQGLGATIQGAYEVSYHGSDVLVVEASEGEDIFWTALTDKEGKPNVGYTLVCGSYDADDITSSTVSVDELTKTCANIIASLKIH